MDKEATDYRACETYMIADLSALGYDVEYTRLERVGHDVCNYAYNEKLIGWMLSKSRI